MAHFPYRPAQPDRRRTTPSSCVQSERGTWGRGLARPEAASRLRQPLAPAPEAIKLIGRDQSDLARGCALDPPEKSLALFHPASRAAPPAAAISSSTIHRRLVVIGDNFNIYKHCDTFVVMLADLE